MRARGVKVNYSLTDHERGLLAMMRKGMTIEEIAFEVGSAPSRTREHLAFALLRERIGILEGQLAGVQAEVIRLADLPMARRQA